MRLVAAALVYAGTAHIVLAATHAESSFGVLVLGAGIVQIAVAVLALFRPSSGVVLACVIVALVPVELYVLNVTTGLPPLIAHSHVSATRSILGFLVAQPNGIEPADVLVQLVELLGAACAANLLRASYSRP